MIRGLARLARERTGSLLSLAAAAGVFLAWRVLGMPQPGGMGRLLPLTWALAGLLLGRRDLPRTSVVFLVGFAVLAPFWAVGQPVFLLASGSLAAGALALAAAGAEGGRLRLALALLALAPLLIVSVPFTGDEPHYAALAESVITDMDLDETNNLNYSDPAIGVSIQSGSLSGSVSHHQPLMSLLVAPGLPGGAAGMRTVSILLAVASALALRAVLRRAGCRRAGLAAFLSAALMPGLGVLATLYPGWVAVGLLCAGAWGGIRGGRAGIWTLGAAMVLLPLLKLRFAPVSAGLLAAWVVYASPKVRIRTLTAAAVLVVLGLAADRFALGGRLFWIRYGNMTSLLAITHRTSAMLGDILLAPVHALLDGEIGLLFKAPWTAAALAGLPKLWRTRRRAVVWLGLPALAYLLVLFVWLPRTWHSMPTAAGRMMLPVLPLMAASGWSLLLGGSRRRLLLMASLAVAGIYAAAPQLRFNLADGTDALLTALGGAKAAGLLPSMIRPSAMALGASVCGLIMVLLAVSRRPERTPHAAAAAVALLLLAGSGGGFAWEAEDLSAGMRRGCGLYPATPDPLARYFWFGGQQRLLRMAHPLDRVALPVPPDADTVELAITGRGLAEGGVRVLAACGGPEKAFLVESSLMDPPAWVRGVRRGRVRRVEMTPGNLRDTTVAITLPVSSDSAVIRLERGYAEPEGLYLDRLEVEGR